MGSWVKCDRRLAENELWLLEAFTKGQAFWDLVMRANHADGTFLCGNKVIEIKRGQLFTSELKLSKRWKWSKKKVRAYLALLETLKMATAHGTTKGTFITIENYSVYQGEGITEDTAQSTAQEPLGVPHRNRKGTAKGTQTRRTKEEPKKDKEELKNIYGEFKNVALAEEELEKLKERFPYDWQERIDKLSAYMESKGKRYKSHYATILSWSRRDKPKDSGFMDV